jgi:arsenate reductase
VDVVITVCADARDETCPVWPGAPVRAHWGVEDPAALEGDEEETLRVFRGAREEIEARVRRLVALPVESLAPDALRAEIEAIGAS